MSSEVIILIVGGVLLLLSLIGSSSKKKLNAPVFILGVLLVIYGGFSYGNINLQGNIEQAEIGNKLKIELPVDTVQVISPLKGDAVKCRILTMGVYPENHDKDIWVVLHPSDNKYYPQSDHTNTSFKRNGEWQVITRFGGDKNEDYEILVYEADAPASAIFSKTILQWKENNSYPGLDLNEIPTGAKLVDKIDVKLLENCRGVH